MTIDEAMKILFDYIGTGPEVEPVEFDKACRLGAEALKRVKDIREHPGFSFDTMLKSETK